MVRHFTLKEVVRLWPCLPNRFRRKCFVGLYPQNGESRDPQKAHLWAETRRMTYRSSKSVHWCGLKNKAKKKFKKVYLTKHNMCFFHVFAQTTHVVAAPHGFACVHPQPGYIFSFIEIRSGFSWPLGGQNLPFPITLAIGFYNKP